MSPQVHEEQPGESPGSFRAAANGLALDITAETGFEDSLQIAGLVEPLPPVQGVDGGADQGVQLDREFDRESDREPVVDREFGVDVPEQRRPSTKLVELAIVIPMFRETNRIRSTVQTLATSVLRDPAISFLFVDDGSDDHTVATAKGAIAEFSLDNASVLPLPVNVGKGGAVKAGINATKGRYFAFLDADLSMDPADVWRGFARLQATGAEMLIGERIVDLTYQPRIRRLASLSFRRLAEAVSGVSVSDPQCAMKIFRADVAVALFGALATDGFAFDVELLARAARKGYRIEQMKIAWQHQPGSKVNPVTDGLRMYRELLSIRRRLNREGL